MVEVGFERLEKLFVHRATLESVIFVVVATSAECEVFFWVGQWLRSYMICRDSRARLVYAGYLRTVSRLQPCTT